MSYFSIDQLQKVLSTSVFHHTKDAKKAAGRALGTFVELITYYLAHQWGLTNNILIERALPEYGNNTISHNVEFTLHPSTTQFEFETSQDNWPITSSKIIRQTNIAINQGYKKKNNVLLTRDGIIKNACVIAENDRYVYSANIDGLCPQQITISKLLSHAFAMFECKRVGIEEGCKKGPQTIEKAKQGAYVARTASSLQKIRNENGDLFGIIYDGSTPIIKRYNELLTEITSTQDKLLTNFILTIGVVSNHGNWYTEDKLNKELKVLAQSYDWLLFLSDEGLAQFIGELLLNPEKRYQCVRDAFIESYKDGKKTNRFTKTKIDIQAHIALTQYFNNNISQIENWFNVVTPLDATIHSLKKVLQELNSKNWEKIL